MLVLCKTSLSLFPPPLSYEIPIPRPNHTSIYLSFIVISFPNLYRSLFVNSNVSPPGDNLLILPNSQVTALICYPYRPIRVTKVSSRVYASLTAQTHHLSVSVSYFASRTICDPIFVSIRAFPGPTAWEFRSCTLAYLVGHILLLPCLAMVGDDHHGCLHPSHILSHPLR